MAANISFIAREYDLTLQLQELFDEYIVLFSRLDNDSGEINGVKEKHFEQAIRLESAVYEMTQLVAQMKSLLSDEAVEENPTLQTISASKRKKHLSTLGQR